MGHRAIIRKGKARLAIIAIAAVVAILVAIALIAKYWILPGVAASQLEQAISSQWQGRVQVGSVDFAYFGPLVLRKVTLRDERGRQWLKAGAVTLTLRNWPSLSPVLTAVDAQDVDVTTYVTDGTVKPPLQPREPDRAPEAAKMVDIESVDVRNLSVSIFDSGGKGEMLANLAFSLSRAGSIYEFSLEQAAIEEDQVLRVSGLVDSETRLADLMLQANKPLHRDRTAQLLKVLDVPALSAVEGSLRLAGRLRGITDDTSSWQLSSEMTLEDATIEAKLAQGPGGAVTVRGTLRGEARIDGTAAVGELTLRDSAFHANLRRGQPREVEFSGDVGGRIASAAAKLQGRTDDAESWRLSVNAAMRDLVTKLAMVAEGEDAADRPYPPAVVSADGTIDAAALDLSGPLAEPAKWKALATLAAQRVAFEAQLMESADGGARADQAREQMLAAISGALGVDARFEGTAGDRGTWQSSGRARLADVSVQGRHGAVMSGAAADIQLVGRSARLSGFAAELAGGRLTGAGQLAIAQDGSVTYGVDLDGANMDLARLTEAFAGPAKKSRQGVVSGKLVLNGAGGDVGGRGMTNLNDADMLSMPILAEIVRQMGLGLDVLSKADGAAVFAISNELITIQEARLANALLAMDAQKGGTVNLKTAHIDFYVVAAPLKEIEGILKLPVIDILSGPLRNLYANLVRFHVVGKWTQPVHELVRKEPLEDVSQATIDFLRDVVKSGGRLGGGVLKGIGDIFQKLGR